MKSFEINPKLSSFITSGIPPAGVQIGMTPQAKASKREIGSPSYKDERMKKSACSK